MGFRLLFLLLVCCCGQSTADLIDLYESNILSPETAVSTVVNGINNVQHLVKYLQNGEDALEMECGLGELLNLSSICSHIQLCGDDICQCCIDNKNRSYADCSGNLFKNELLEYIPPLPSGVQVLKFSWNGLSSEDIDEDFFDNVRNITHLYLSNNVLEYIERNMFKKLTKLKCLNVNGNTLLKKNPASLQELLAIPGLQALGASGCLFPLDDVQFPENSSVQSLFVSLNPSIDSFTYDMTELSKLTDLKLVLFEHNPFKLVYTRLPLQAEIIVFSFTSLIALPITCSERGISLFPELEALFLQYNTISDPYNYVGSFCLPKLTTLDLSFNLISTLRLSLFSNEHFPKLQSLSVRKQIVFLRPFSIQAKAFSNPSLKELYMEHNDIWFRRKDLVASDAFDNCTHLTLLYLDGNSFRDVDDDRFLELFGGLHSLKVLSLTDCQFETVSTRTFQTLTWLTHLYLDGNLISHIPSKTFQPLKHLKLLDLSNNKLAFLGDQAFRNGFQYTLYLSLSRNPFICSCELIWLKELQKQSRRLVVAKQDYFSKTYRRDRAANYKCDNLQGFSVANFSLARQACLLSEQTNVLITYTCSLLIVALTAFLLLFSYRWHFRLLLYEAFRGNGQARRLRLQQNNFNYDVFVSYASEDLPWVRQHLMSQLEEQLGLRLCIHERDFILGHNIVDNIAECVESSKKILMVFSKSFVLSQWCQFELTYCLTHVLEYDDSLIVVCVDDVVSHEMTSAMMAVLKTTTYIQWMEEEYYATESFWGRIKIALQEIMDVGEHVV